MLQTDKSGANGPKLLDGNIISSSINQLMNLLFQGTQSTSCLFARNANVGEMKGRRERDIVIALGVANVGDRNRNRRQLRFHGFVAREDGGNMLRNLVNLGALRVRFVGKVTLSIKDLIRS